MAETEGRNTHKVYEKDKIGEVQIADEVVAIIAPYPQLQTHYQKDSSG